jgi:hypothetical protein
MLTGIGRSHADDGVDSAKTVPFDKKYSPVRSPKRPTLGSCAVMTPIIDATSEAETEHDETMVTAENAPEEKPLLLTPPCN